MNFDTYVNLVMLVTSSSIDGKKTVLDRFVYLFYCQLLIVADKAKTSRGSFFRTGDLNKVVFPLAWIQGIGKLLMVF